MNNLRESDETRPDWFPCCGVEYRGSIEHGSRCDNCGDIMVWCRGCGGGGEGHSASTCDVCGDECCPDCQWDPEDDDVRTICFKCGDTDD